MPPLVVIRSGCKHVEYLKSRSVWRHAPHVNDSDEDAADDQESEDDALLRQAEDNWRRSISSSCNVTKVSSGYSNELCDVGGMHAFRCADCGNIVADRDDVVSKTFFGRSGKAFLMNNMYFIHSAAAFRLQCDFVLGWKYIKAMESSQKYKEGKFIMEQAVVQDDSEEKAWNRL
ncbi:Protein yippee-like 2 [Phytophthora boehmeriae]|uniref:Protein yippee-like 2 n=1 Tax=Phytophthora boehmeriae TaxID=109152 RepID=A0A8T1WGU2_9STRA|nr:Protein yippee-like 2 [Phytophthora boehmeriae]